MSDITRELVKQYNFDPNIIKLDGTPLFDFIPRFFYKYSLEELENWIQNPQIQSFENNPRRNIYTQLFKIFFKLQIDIYQLLNKITQFDTESFNFQPDEKYGYIFPVRNITCPEINEFTTIFINNFNKCIVENPIDQKKITYFLGISEDYNDPNLTIKYTYEPQQKIDYDYSNFTFGMFLLRRWNQEKYNFLLNQLKSKNTFYKILNPKKFQKLEYEINSLRNILSQDSDWYSQKINNKNYTILQFLKSLKSNCEFPQSNLSTAFKNIILSSNEFNHCQKTTTNYKNIRSLNCILTRIFQNPTKLALEKKLPRPYDRNIKDTCKMKYSKESIKEFAKTGLVTGDLPKLEEKDNRIQTLKCSEIKDPSLLKHPYQGTSLLKHPYQGTPLSFFDYTYLYSQQSIYEYPTFFIQNIIDQLNNIPSQIQNESNIDKQRELRTKFHKLQLLLLIIDRFFNKDNKYSHIIRKYSQQNNDDIDFIYDPQNPPLPNDNYVRFATADINEIKNMLRRIPNINLKDTHGMNLIIYSIFNNDPNVFKLITQRNDFIPQATIDQSDNVSYYIINTDQIQNIIDVSTLEQIQHMYNTYLNDKTTITQIITRDDELYSQQMLSLIKQNCQKNNTSCDDYTIPPFNNKFDLINKLINTGADPDSDITGRNNTYRKLITYLNNLEFNHTLTKEQIKKLEQKISQSGGKINLKYTENIFNQINPHITTIGGYSGNIPNYSKNRREYNFSTNNPQILNILFQLSQQNGGKLYLIK